MADQHNDNIPELANQIAADIPDIKENLEWHKDVLQMLIGWHNSTIGSLSPPGPQRSKFTWKDADEIYIGPGVYFHDGTVRQAVFWDATITFKLQAAGSNALSDDYGTDGWHYIYIDDSAVVTNASQELVAACFLNDTTAPTWSDSKHGWYNGSDRCIFAVYETSDAILEFYNDGGDYVEFADAITVQSGGTFAAAFTDVTALTSPTFATKANVSIYTITAAGYAPFYYRKNGQTGATGHYIGTVYSASPRVNNLDVYTDTSQLIELKSASANTYSVYQNGWYFPVGM